MIYINKGQEPEELKIFNRNRRNKFVQWGDESVPPAVYVEIKKSLYKEQKGYCAYCLRLIDESCRVEHFIPRSKNSSLIWDYNNMLGVDNPQQLPPKYRGMCENGRGNKSLSISPLNIAHMSGIYYLKDGRIMHDKYQSDLDNVLRLNNDSFKAARKAIFDGVDRAYKPLVEQNIANIYDILIENYIDSTINEFSEVAIWYLNDLHNKKII